MSLLEIQPKSQKKERFRFELEDMIGDPIEPPRYNCRVVLSAAHGPEWPAIFSGDLRPEGLGPKEEQGVAPNAPDWSIMLWPQLSDRDPGGYPIEIVESDDNRVRAVRVGLREIAEPEED